ncbi:fumarylacetoacetate hydrolase family protein [Aquibaculum sediminis]|uniref:fumarylacetoacetate hydrolase family protein n=1 Tax=Aquibaculum sediminis TaxID=3231907 RepID=UPI003455979D
MELKSEAAWCLPDDAADAVLVGRVWRPDVQGPAVVVVRGNELLDVTDSIATVSALCAEADPASVAKNLSGESLGDLQAILANTPRQGRDSSRPWLLSPIDLQAVKASGVTFVISLLERVIEEQARGNPAQAETARKEIQAAIGQDLASLKPGSEEAMALKELLIQKGVWSQYLEVGIGPDVEVFTKAQPLSSVGHLAEVGVHPGSAWNNPEPEVVLAVAPDGRIVGATLGNDVNLRDVEGRSALLLGKAKDNNASASLGPFLRLFDGGFDLDSVRSTKVSLTVEGEDDFRLEGESEMRKIARDPADIVAQTIGPHHQYPDGFVLYLGTMFAPVEDRDAPGQGFTHKSGDIVTIGAPELGRLVNRVVPCDEAEPWTFGMTALFRSLQSRAQKRQA